MNSMNPIYLDAQRDAGPVGVGSMSIILKNRMAKGARILQVVPDFGVRNGVMVTNGMWVFFDEQVTAPT